MNTSRNSRIVAGVAGLILAISAGCGGDDARSEQARALLERIARLDIRAPADRRAQQIQHLRGLSLADPELARVRDACALAHAGLLAAETEQAGVRRRIEAAADAGPSELELASIASALQQAGRRLRDAHGALPECETQTRVLLERYR
jgi:hypothetical protein